MSDEDWEAILQEVRECVPCEDCGHVPCEYDALCRYLRACASPSEAE